MKRLGILVVAYNAASTLAKVLDRIPADFRPRVSDVLVCDDSSRDATYLVGLGYKKLDPDFPLTVIRQPRSLGYGGNQKAAFRWAIEHDLDIVVLLHADGKYAPELLPEMVGPLERAECDAVFGSRMLERGAARAGGMPLYKVVGNRLLTSFENAMVGTQLSEWHSGYRAYSVAALTELPFESNSDDFDFDTQMIIQLHEAGKRIVEIPIPTYYGDEISYVKGFTYARDSALEVVRYRLHKMGLGRGGTAFASVADELKLGANTSHGRMLAWLQARPPGRVLHVGCSDGSLSERVRALGHEVTGVETEELGAVRDRVDRFVEDDLDAGIPPGAGDGFDVVLLGEVLGLVRHPGLVLDDASRLLAPGGTVVACIANFGHWYPRIRVSLGLFDYDRRGILDRRSLRFFTRRSFEHLVTSHGLEVRRREAIGPPVEVVRRGRRGPHSEPGPLSTLVQRIDNLGVTLRPTLFAYQFLFELVPTSASG